MCKCEYCGKKQNELNACSLFSLWLCDVCYGTTLNPYLRETKSLFSWIESIEKKLMAISFNELLK